MSGIRDTLHDFSIEYVKAIAEVFGWEVETAMGSRHGPDVIIIHRGINGDVDTVMFIETEIGHDLGVAKRYFETLSRRLRPIIERYRTEYGDSVLFKIVIITNTPRRLTAYLRENKEKLGAQLGFQPVEGLNIFITRTAT